MRILIIVALIFSSQVVLAQSGSHPPTHSEMPAEHSARGDTTMKGHDMRTHTMGGHSMMPGPLGLSMNRLGSGTSWLPDATPMYAVHRMAGKWTAMLHGQAFLQYDAQGGDRGANQAGSINWGMAMVSRNFGKATSEGNAPNRLTLRSMLSLDALTVTEKGYPLLLQSGETYKGAPLVDRQHPHDLFMELAAVYDRQLSSSLGLQLYAAPVGEPAIGPVAFMHRPSAINDPFSPLSHHWQDATHISFGVVTAGLFTKLIKIEGSVFNGREPDEHRFDFDFRRLDSYSGRVTVNPTPSLSFQGSYAYLDSPEALEPDVSIHRLSGSVMLQHSLGMHSDWSTSLIYGGNKAPGDDISNSIVLESNLNADARNAIFGRFEYVQKDSHDLDIPTLGVEQRYNIGSFTLGYVRELYTGSAGSLGLGARGTVNVISEVLTAYYGTKNPTGLGVFLRYRPKQMH